jgi:hypothetical protein
MTISATSVRFDEHTMWVELTDGRTLGVPLAWFPRLLRATPVERNQVELSRVGLHWEALDEDISIAGLLAGRGDITRSTEHAAWYRSAQPFAIAPYALLQGFGGSLGQNAALPDASPPPELWVASSSQSCRIPYSA